MISNVKQHQYSLAFKYRVVDEVEAGQITYKQAQKKYHIQGAATVLEWLLRYGRLDWSNGIPKLLRTRSLK
ncbi:hypothetical protein [Vibrio variabilis]|uniref:hypothetical protein n=1 Tax=Vibrio variabilis TaxID=990271 RepID=UPI000DDB8A13